MNVFLVAFHFMHMHDDFYEPFSGGNADLYNDKIGNSFAEEIARELSIYALFQMMECHSGTYLL